MTTLMIINGAAYGQDTTYNALRLAVAMSKRDGVTVQVFLMGDGVTAAMDGQKTPDGYYKLDKMLSAGAAHSGRIGCCGTCMDARDITDALLTGAAKGFTMKDLADWTLAAEKVLIFYPDDNLRDSRYRASSPSPPAGGSKAFPLPTPSFKPRSQDSTGSMG